MILKINGKPIKHHHNCPQERLGKKMSNMELQEFAVESLIEEYKLAKYKEVVRHSEDFNSGADFSFKDFGKTICGKVVYAQDYNINLNMIDTSQLYSTYLNGNIIPRLYLASACCVSSEDGSLLCGGDFVFKFHEETLMFDEGNPVLEDELDHINLVKKYITLWETGNTQIILQFFHKNFRSYSISGFNPIVSRKEYFYFFSLTKESDKSNSFSMQIGKDTDTGEIGIIASDVYNGHRYFVSIKTDKGRILRSWTHHISESIVEYNPEKELYQSHGSHINAIMPQEQFVNEILPRIIKNAKLYRKVIVNGHIVYSLRYVAGQNDFLMLIGENKKNHSNEFITTYPYLPGKTVDAEIIEVLEWNNKVEATILCKVGEFNFAFFATDYYANKDAYFPTAKISVQLAALGINVKPAQEGFSFEGQKAIDFLAKIGQKPNFDENGEVEPVNFSLKELVAFLNNDDRCPDEAEFQSPIGVIEKTSILGVRYNKCEIVINRDEDIVVPLYFSDVQYPTPKDNGSICGWLWMTGRLNLCKKSMTNLLLCQIGKKFYNTINSFDFKNFDQLNFILESLSGISLPNGFDLDAVGVGDRHGSYLHLYATKNKREFHPELDNNGKVINKMEDDMYMYGLVSYEVSKVIPPIEHYLKVEQTPEGIMSAYLIYVSQYILPRVWHANYGARDYIFSLEDLDKIRVVDCSQYRNDSILPSIEFSSEVNGILSVSYWNDYSGMNRYLYRFEWDNGHVTFNPIQSEILVKYKSSIIF